MASGIFNSTYYGKDYRAGAALLRARRPYLVKNALTGLGLVAFTISVCTFDSDHIFSPESQTRNHTRPKELSTNQPTIQKTPTPSVQSARMNSPM
ncbi:unnamed protein product [Aspergillus oryzae]|nr:unnamed protein product [Aspergillus oryzae]